MPSPTPFHSLTPSRPASPFFSPRLQPLYTLHHETFHPCSSLPTHTAHTYTSRSEALHQMDSRVWDLFFADPIGGTLEYDGPRLDSELGGDGVVAKYALRRVGSGDVVDMFWIQKRDGSGCCRGA
ncbi:hypothetical protein PMIN02_010401 [Paraphaeosphaeria minitans]|uniref:Uncharacterized protein n=1 Tax=Paraphaeosphaeria minitans TaxID=565426 RepID=A0A9P6GMV8_9PLEO|nr:hypothetical protein PMIN01_04793 [Paraphaeosphaeria minitans]